MTTELTIGNYILKKLKSYNVNHVFGVPGDYALSFCKVIEESDVTFVNTCDEQGAGFAADAYARLNGLGAVCITYCVGGLKTANTTAQAFAEKSPVIVISGSPGINERNHNPLLHHKVRNFNTQFKVYEEFTAASAVIDNPQTACREIDRLFDVAVQRKRPVYLELPRDMVAQPAIPYTPPVTKVPSECVHEALLEALDEAAKIINSAKKPVILAGLEMHRFGYRDLLLQLIERTNIPVAATLLGKTVISELHPLYLGVYEGAMGREDVREYVESSDCLILLGTFMTDVNLGIYTAKLDQAKSISVNRDAIRIHYHNYNDICMKGFLNGLFSSHLNQRPAPEIPTIPEPQCPEASDQPITIDYLFRYLNTYIDDNSVVIADPGEAMFAAIDMVIHNDAEFFSPAYYTSLGFAVPASLGVQTFNPDLRPIVLVGDGAFQMTGMELSTSLRFNLNPIIIVLNNNGYGTERPMIDGKFNDVLNWNYSKLPDFLGHGLGFKVTTETELISALESAKNNTNSFTILDIRLDQADSSPALKRLTAALAKRVKNEHSQG